MRIYFKPALSWLQHELVLAGGGYAISSGLFGLENQQRLSASLIVEPELHRSVVLAHTIRIPNTRAARVVQQWFEKQAPKILKRMIVNRRWCVKFNFV